MCILCWLGKEYSMVSALLLDALTQDSVLKVTCHTSQVKLNNIPL